MALGIPLVLGLLGGTGLLLVASGKKKVPTGMPGEVPAGAEPPLPLTLKKQLMNALKTLTVNEQGKIVGPVTGAAVQQATQVASQLAAAGYPIAAATLREYARQAGTMLPSPPPAEQVPIPNVSPSIQEKLTRAIQFEGDPQKLRAIAAALKALPNASDPQVQMAIGFTEAKAAQIEAAQSTGQAVQKVDDVLKGKVEPRMMPRMQTTPPVPAPPRREPAPPPPPPPPMPTVLRPEPVAPVAVPKSPAEIAADAMVMHLLRLQSRYESVRSAKGREDKALVGRFQRAADIQIDGKAGPGTLTSAAQHGQAKLPLVMYWPRGSTKTRVFKYRDGLYSLADQAQAMGNPVRAAELRASAKRERGQAGIVGTMPA